MNNNVSNTTQDEPEVPELAIDDKQAVNFTSSSGNDQEASGGNSNRKKHMQKKIRRFRIGILLVCVVIIATTVSLVVHYTKKDTGTSSVVSGPGEQQVTTDNPTAFDPSVPFPDENLTSAPTGVVSANTTTPSETKAISEEGTFPPLTYESGIPTVWEQVGEDIYGPNPNMYFGHSVSTSFSGTILIAGAPGGGIAQAYQFNFSTQVWDRLGQTLGGTLQDDTDDFGYAVSMSSDGEAVAISAPNYNEGTGKVYIYARNISNSEWFLLQELEGISKGDGFGASISLSGDGSTVAIGAIQFMSRMAGYVDVFRLDGEGKNTNWSQFGDRLTGDAGRSHRFGSSVALSNNGNSVIIGVPFKGDAGQVYVFRHNKTLNSWYKLGSNKKLSGDSTRYSRHKYGSSVAISFDGKIVAYASVVHRSAVKVLKLSKSSKWKQLGTDIDVTRRGPPGNFYQSISLSDSGTVLAIGSWIYGLEAYDEKELRPEMTGVVNIYEYIFETDKWTVISQDVFGETEKSFFGWTTSLSGDGSTLAIGGPESDDYGFNSGHVQVYHRSNCSCTPASISIVIKLDLKASETGWILACESRGTMRRVIPGYYEKHPGEVVQHHVSVIEGDNCTITIEDTGNDGIYGGSYEVFYGTEIENFSNQLIVGDTDFSDKVYEQFLVELKYTSWNKEGQLLIGSKGDTLGSSVAISSSGNIVIAGASGLNEVGKVEITEAAGSARVFEFDSVTQMWKNLGQQLLSGEKIGSFGFDVSISGDGTVVAVSGPRVNKNTGLVHIYKLKDARLWDLDEVLSGNEENYYFGSSLSLSGDGSTIAVSAIHEQGESIVGTVKVFQYGLDGNNRWEQIGNVLSGSQPDGIVRFGKSVALSHNGSILIVGAPSNNDLHRGKPYSEVFYFDKSTGDWYGFGDNNIFWGETSSSGMGESVAISRDGDVVAIADPSTSGRKASFYGTTRVIAGDGKVQVYKYNNNKNTWTKVGNDILGAYHIHSYGAPHGVSLSDSGMVVAIGGVGPENYGTRVFEYDSDEDDWIPSSQIIQIHASDYSPPIQSVSLNGDGSILAIGDPDRYYMSMLGEVAVLKSRKNKA